MKYSVLITKIAEMRHGEFLRPDEIKFLEKEVGQFIKNLDNFFGDNDGEPLDETGIKFVIDYLKLKLKLFYGVYDQ